MTHTHVAGSIHADAGSRAPGWLGVPDDVNALLPGLWSAGVGKDVDGVLTVAGLDVAEIAEQVGTPAYVMDEADRCDRLLLMREGRIIADGSPDEIRRSTGAPDIEQAFLHLVEGPGGAR